MKVEEVLKKVLRKVKPSEEEKKEMRRIAEEVIRRLQELTANLEFPVEIQLVGSAARDTWISGNRELDIFLLFPPNLSEEEMERIGLEIGRKVSENYEEMYAEHPYVRVKIDSWNVDIVPCFKIDDPSKRISAVDRTPFHNEYLKKKIKGKEDEVLLLKQFMKGIDVYGAEASVQGFSGFLCELLILYYGSFLETLRGASKWKKGERIDIEGHGNYEGDDALIVIDPVDPKRNAAAAVSIDSMAKFVDASRSFLKNPSLEFFFPERKILTKKELLEILKKRETLPIVILWETGGLEEVIYPQLRKAQESISSMLERLGFKVLRSGIFYSSYPLLLLEMEVWKLPRVEKHLGPFFTQEFHAERFKRKYNIIYIENGRYIAERERKYTEAREALEKEVKNCSTGKNLKASYYRVLVGEEILEIEDKKFTEFLSKFFHARFQ
jgi:tRNA nucleotidyltransferase (CCA-adding enzyme)